MFQAARAVFSLLLSYGLLLMGNGLFGTLLGIRATLEGFPTQVTGIIMSGHFIGLLVGGLLAVGVVARVGHIRAFAAFASIMSVAALAHILVLHPVVWFVLRLATGFCMAGMIMVTESWLNERSERSIRGQVLALYMITNYLGSGAGVTAGGGYLYIADGDAGLTVFRECGPFYDGFESGDATVWSSTNP